MAQLISIGVNVTPGEHMMHTYLQTMLPDDWFILGNPMVTTRSITREIDAIVVGDCRVWVIDDKGYSGRITGDEHVWILPNNDVVDGVMYKVLHTAMIVKGKIISRQPQLRNVWVEGLIILSGRDITLSIDDVRVERHVHHLKGVETHLMNPRLHSAPPLSIPDRIDILRALTGSRIIDRFLANNSGMDLPEPTMLESRVPIEENSASGNELSFEPMYVRIDGPNSFQRIYYQDVILGRTEFRGCQPIEAVHHLEGSHLALRFHSRRVELVLLHAMVPVLLNDIRIVPDRIYLLPMGQSTLTLGELRVEIHTQFLG